MDADILLFRYPGELAGTRVDGHAIGAADQGEGEGVAVGVCRLDGVRVGRIFQGEGVRYAGHFRRLVERSDPQGEVVSSLAAVGIELDADQEGAGIGQGRGPGDRGAFARPKGPVHRRWWFGLLKQVDHQNLVLEFEDRIVGVHLALDRDAIGQADDLEFGRAGVRRGRIGQTGAAGAADVVAPGAATSARCVAQRGGRVARVDGCRTRAWIEVIVGAVREDGVGVDIVSGAGRRRKGGHPLVQGVESAGGIGHEGDEDDGAGVGRQVLRSEYVNEIQQGSGDAARSEDDLYVEPVAAGVGQGRGPADNSLFPDQRGVYTGGLLYIIGLLAICKLIGIPVPFHRNLEFVDFTRYRQGVGRGGHELGNHYALFGQGGGVAHGAGELDAVRLVGDEQNLAVPEEVVAY